MSLRSKSLFGILLVLSLTILGFFLVYLDHQNPENPEAVVKSQLEAIQQGKFTEAYYSFTSKEFQASTSLDEFKRYIRAFPEIQKDSQIQVEGVREVNNLKEVTVELSQPNKTPLSIKLQLIKENEKWKILNLKAGSEEKKSLTASQHIIISMIEEVLKLIKNAEYEKAYMTFTTAEFKKEFDLEAFKDFIKSYPILSIFTYSELIDFSDSDDLTIAKIRFENSLQEASVAFTLQKKGTNWKINNIEVLGQNVKAGAAKTFNEEEIILPIRQLLYLIKNHNSEKAYQLYTSQAFQDSTTLQNFQEFIKGNPILINYKLPDFKKLQFNNNVGEYTVLLNNPPEKPHEALFSLIREKGEWKVLQIQLNETEE